MEIKNGKYKSSLVFNFNRNILIKLIYFFFMIDLINTDGCFISNKTTITSQWLNNIICLGATNLRYINFATFSNGDMIVEATSTSDYSDRIFYGIKSSGEPFFSNDQYHSKITISGETESNNARNEAEIFIVTIDSKEYVFSIGSGSNIYAELYDLSTCEVLSQKLSTSLLSTSKILSVRESASVLTVSNKNYIIFPFLDSDTDLYIKKIYFSSTDIVNNSPTISSYSISSKGRAVSCFVTESNYIVCLFLHINIMVLQYYHIGIYDTNLNKQKEIVTDYCTKDHGLFKDYSDFSKCIHLEGDIGVFIFFKASKVGILYVVDTYPIIIFQKITSTSISDYLPEISLDKKEFHPYCLLNDLIKISTTKLCFISTSTSKEELYNVLINIFNTDKVVLRYYTLDIYSKYTFKFLYDMRLNLYNNFISFAFSFCRQSSCEDDDTHYAGLMIFSYPNGTDYNLNLTKYIFDNDDIDNLIIDLKDNVRIDNNIFGLIYSGIIIKAINNCDNMNLFSSVNTNTYISVSSQLEKDEKIKIIFSSLYKVNCLISYTYIITEPDFEVYNNYAERYTDYGTDTADIFNNAKSTYESRVLNYYIKLDENLVRECSDENCDLCPENSLDYCLICKFDYTKSNGVKNCNPNTDLIDETETTNDKTELSEDKTNNINTENQDEDSKEIIDSTEKFESTDISTTSTEKQKSEENESDTTKETTKNEETEESETDTTKETIKNEKSQNNKESEITCSSDEILNNECDNRKMTNEQVSQIFSTIKDNFLNKNYTGENTIIETENVILQISTLEDQKNSDNSKVSNIDLGDCEGILRTKYNISDEYPLIVIKTDIKSEDLSSTYVQYEIYHPVTKIQLDLNYCSEATIVVSVPVNLDNNTISLYDRLSESGYNLFDSEDDFYNDICSTYTTENGTDLTLADRKSEIYSTAENISMCQTGCEFESYNKTTKKAKCNCEAQTNSTETDISKIDFSFSSIASSFLSTLKNSNFLVLKCYKLVLTLTGIIKNKGRIIMTLIYLFYLITLILFIIKDRTKIDYFINIIIKNKTNESNLPKKK